MSDRTPTGIQIDSIWRGIPFVQQSFDLLKQDQFVTGLGVDFLHYKAIPSPIGKKDRGDYRRQDGVDTITSNGFIYKCAGIFTATITDNTSNHERGDSGIVDDSTSRLVMPRFYNQNALADGNRIYLEIGDRLYIKDADADVKVVTYHEMDYQEGVDNITIFPICNMDGPIIDSKNIEYIENLDFIVTAEGNIRWLDGGKNPGIDPDTGKGRIYSIRYLYKAYWYVVSLTKEVRITNVTTGGVRSPERAAYYPVIMREYLFHNQNRGGELNQLKPKVSPRTDAAVSESINPAKPIINVDMSSLTTEEE
jgi:hypothetical protein